MSITSCSLICKMKIPKPAVIEILHKVLSAIMFFWKISKKNIFQSSYNCNYLDEKEKL